MTDPAEWQRQAKLAVANELGQKYADEHAKLLVLAEKAEALLEAIRVGYLLTGGIDRFAELEAAIAEARS